MTLILSGSDGLSDVDGSAATPAIRGTDANTGIFFPAADTIAFAEGGVESMRLDSSGRLIVNGTSASSISTIYPASGSSNTLTYRTSGNTGAGSLYAYSDGNGPASGIGNNFSINSAGSSSRFNTTYAAWGIWMDCRTGSEAMRFDYLNTSGTYSEYMRITPSGQLSIGASISGIGRFGVTNPNNTSGDQNTTLILGANCNNTSSYYLICTTITTGSDRLYILGNGNVQNINNSYGALSDVKLKENIVDATPKLADLMQVKVRNYNLIGETTKQIGVVAQELEQVFPSMIDEMPDRDADGNQLDTKTKAVKYSVFVPMLIKAIQEQQALITALTDRITALEAK